MEFRLPHVDMINHIIKDMNDLGLLAYIDDLLIYAETREEHDEIVKEVLQKLRDNKLAVSAEKCEWRKAYWNGNYSRVARPLTELTKGDGPTRQNERAGN